MALYRLNMAKGHVIPLDQRRKWRRLLTIYFVAMLVVLGLGVGYEANRILSVRAAQRQVSAQEQRFLAERPNARGMERYVLKMGADLEACADRLEAIAAFNPCECGAAAMLLGLIHQLPSGMELGHAGLDAGTRRLGFTVYVPAGRKIGENETPPNLISRWSEEPLLAGRVSGLTAGRSERISEGGVDILSWQFSGELGGGK